MIKPVPIVTGWSYSPKIAEPFKLNFIRFHSIAPPRDKWDLFYHFYVKVICSYII